MDSILTLEIRRLTSEFTFEIKILTGCGTLVFFTNFVFRVCMFRDGDRKCSVFFPVIALVSLIFPCSFNLGQANPLCIQLNFLITY